jgi:hypothetical protein
MNRRAFIALGAAGLCRGQKGGDASGAARDLLYQALELLWEHSTRSQVESALSRLRTCLDENASFGDAHYYRARCLERLGLNPGMQKSELEAAVRYGSEAQRDARDPFKLAVPRIHVEDLTTVGQKWALVVGISKFQPQGGADPLRFAANDAEAFAGLLTDPKIGRFQEDHVLRLTNDKATAPAIKGRLNTIATKAKPEDIVLVYISTHGSSRTDDLRQVSYLYTYDTDVTSRDQVFGTALPMVEVSGIISTRCVAQRTIVLFDTCHSGAGLAAQSLSTADFDRLRAGAGRYIVSSCGDKERSYEEGGHGFFTASLIDALSERRGCVRMKDLFERVQKDVSDRARKLNKDQHPIMARSDNAAEILLGAGSGDKSEGCLV